MKSADKHPRIHTFICTNEREPGKTCCFRAHGHEIFSKLKERAKKEGIYSRSIVTRSGCLGLCNDNGATLVIFKEGEPAKWYTEATEADIETIWQDISQPQ